MRLQRVGQKILTIGNPGLSVISPRGGAAAIPWYLAGGVSAADCIFAVQPKGAASYTASKVNLANPGAYDAYKLSASDPAWSATNGWEFDGSTVLGTNITESIDSSAAAFFIRCTNRTTNRWIFGQSSFCALYSVVQLGPELSNGYASLSDFTIAVISDETSGNVYSYLDGSLVETDGTSAFANYTGVFGIGGRNTGGTGTACYFESMSIYKTVPTAEQRAAIESAMESL